MAKKEKQTSAAKKVVKKATEPLTERISPRKTTERYFQGTGRRKTAVARVKLYTRGERTMSVNDRDLGSYFSTPALRDMARGALRKMNVEDKFRVVARLGGGGLSSQAEAMRHGTARALLAFNPEFRKRLKRAGYLTRDPRVVERKKPGKKKARRSPQWSKR